MLLKSDQISNDWNTEGHSLPLVINESLVHFFHYWSKALQSGMRYGHELYAFHQTFSLNQRAQAYSAAYEYAEQGNQVCITVSKQGYTVWLNLRSRNCLAALSTAQTAECLTKLL